MLKKEWIPPLTRRKVKERIAAYFLSTAECFLSIADYFLSTAECFLSIADYFLSIAECLFFRMKERKL